MHMSAPIKATPTRLDPGVYQLVNLVNKFVTSKMVLQYQKISFENIRTSNMIGTQQVIFKNINVYIYKNI